MSNICILGTGYVGLVTGTCLAELGHAVVCVDVDPAKVERLRRGEPPIFEPGLEPLVRRNLDEGRLGFTGDLGAALRPRDLVLVVAVGTPSAPDGSADLRGFFAAVDEAVRLRAAQSPEGRLTLVVKSTVPVGTCRWLQAMVGARLEEGRFAVVSNPEFLREGCAVDDFLRPDRIVVGCEDADAAAAMREVYRPLTERGTRLIEIDTLETAEMIKYAANVFLATRIGLLNEFARLCESVGADVSALAEAVGADRRIGPAFLKAGPGFGGSCFPKDLAALTRFAAGGEDGAGIAAAVIEANERHKRAMARKVAEALGGSLEGRRVALLGLAFKAGTDDVREAPALAVALAMTRAGARVVAFDPVAGAQARRECPAIELAGSVTEALVGADAAVVATEWAEFLAIDWAEARLAMRTPVVVDLRNMLDARCLLRLGFAYRGVGRFASPAPRPILAASTGPADRRPFQRFEDQPLAQAAE
ncbi:UDP-glucose/GDP-mannose dehydrogenase family protein [Aureimonas sp. AU4]|uniref:UDP-glucose dehydrogenase family protein n=1 Tax=Aureimonas sp. AU4 TaxID=1638163 RepID=UPI0009EBE951|nr:UDP-glucose/GDP-mannose dehydrogenase family protein [Aureimonas sp. AU4]